MRIYRVKHGMWRRYKKNKKVVERLYNSADAGACQRMFALPFYSNKVPWAMKYNNFTDPVM